MSKLEHKILGKGAYGVVEQTISDNKLYAQKIIAVNNQGLENPIELDILSRLRHPHLSQSLNFEHIIKNDVSHYGIKMNIALKGDLFCYTQKYKINVDLAMKFILSLVDAVDFLHSCNILHLDIKPENILVFDQEGLTDPFLQLADSGLSVLAHRSRAIKKYTIKKENKTYLYRYSDMERITRLYQSPECLSGSKNYTDKSDIWALGFTFIYILNQGVLPFDYNKNFQQKINIFLGDAGRSVNLTKFLSKLKGDPRQHLIIDLLSMMLNPNPEFRASIEDVKNHILFKNANYYEGSIMNPSINPDGISGIIVDDLTPHYQALYIIVKLSHSFNLHVETLFLATDLYYRTMASFASLNRPHSNYSETSTSAISCVWIAIKMIEVEQHFKLEHLIYILSQINISNINHIDIIDREREILINMKGIIYRLNPFNSSSNTKELINNFDIINNINEYISNDLKWLPVEQLEDLTLTKSKDFLIHTNNWPAYNL